MSREPDEQELLVAPAVLAAIPSVGTSNTDRRRWLSYFRFRSVESYECLVFARRIERNGCGNYRHTNDDPKDDLLVHGRQR